jgi:hypothetical protein
MLDTDPLSSGSAQVMAVSDLSTSDFCVSDGKIHVNDLDDPTLKTLTVQTNSDSLPMRLETAVGNWALGHVVASGGFVSALSYVRNGDTLNIYPVKVALLGKQLTGYAPYTTEWTNWDDTHLVTAAEIKAAIMDDSQTSPEGGGGTVILTTTIVNYDETQIGCFCYSIGNPLSLDSPVVEVMKWNATFAADTAKKIVGIIQGPNTVVTYGPVLCRPAGAVGVLDIGDFVIPSVDPDGCQVATAEQRTIVTSSGMPRVRIMNEDLPNGMLACFIN